MPALRVRADGAVVRFVDRVMGAQEGVVDDFVVRRNDGAFAYNLAVVVDDLAQGVEEVVRGADLLDSTPRQIWLERALAASAAAPRRPPTASSRPTRTFRSSSTRRVGDWRSATVTSRCVRSSRLKRFSGWRRRWGFSGRTARDLLAGFDPDSFRVNRPSGSGRVWAYRISRVDRLVTYSIGR